MAEPIEALLSPREAARLLGVSPRTLSNWRWAGFPLPHVHVGSRVFYAPAALRAFIQERTRHPTVDRRTLPKAG